MRFPSKSGLVAAALLGLAGGCDVPTTLLVCHNSNCAEPVDPERDDTVSAMRESLALQVNGRPAIDGIEIDLLYRARDGACLFAHDFENVEEAPALAPAAELAVYFAAPGDISYSPDRAFRIAIELKSHVSEDPTDRHTAAEATAHAACTWEVYTAIADAAVANRRDVEVLFSAFAPDLLRAMIVATPATLPVPVRYGGIQGIPKPLDAQTFSLDEYAGIPLTEMEFHAHWLLDAQYEAIRSLDLEIAFFMFSATAETFAMVRRYEPSMVVTSEATLFRRWLDR